MKTKGDSLGEEQLKKLGEEEDAEEKPATERRKDTDLGESDENVACHASALASVMTDEECREAEM